MIENGANINHKDDEGTPIIHYAVFNNNAEMVDLFIASGVNLKAKDQYGLTALVYALKEKSPQIVQSIKAAGGKY